MIAMIARYCDRPSAPDNDYDPELCRGPEINPNPEIRFHNVSSTPSAQSHAPA